MNQFQNPYINPYVIGGFNPVQPAPTMPTQVVKVSGENGARAYQMGPNSSALLLDESGLMVWLCTSDGAGYKTVSAYDIAPHKEEKPKDYSDLESRIARLEEQINATSNTSATRKKSGRTDDVES